MRDFQLNRALEDLDARARTLLNAISPQQFQQVDLACNQYDSNTNEIHRRWNDLKNSVKSVRDVSLGPAVSHMFMIFKIHTTHVPMPQLILTFTRQSEAHVHNTLRAIAHWDINAFKEYVRDEWMNAKIAEENAKNKRDKENNRANDEHRTAEAMNETARSLEKAAEKKEKTGGLIKMVGRVTAVMTLVDFGLHAAMFAIATSLVGELGGNLAKKSPRELRDLAQKTSDMAKKASATEQNCREEAENAEKDRVAYEKAARQLQKLGDELGNFRRAVGELTLFCQVVPYGIGQVKDATEEVIGGNRDAARYIVTISDRAVSLSGNWEQLYKNIVTW